MTHNLRRHFTSRPILTISSLVLLCTVIEARPRISLTRDINSTTLTYKHRSSLDSAPTPSDRGIVLTPTTTISERITIAKDNLSGQYAPRGRADEWLLDTGASNHVCCDRKFMHSLLKPSFRSHGVVTGMDAPTVNFGPSPVVVKGRGAVTFELPPPSPAADRKLISTRLISIEKKPPHIDTEKLGITFLQGEEQLSAPSREPRVTIDEVEYIPDAGVNLISWGQLKKAKGSSMALREGENGELEVWEDKLDIRLMTFVLRNQQYYLVQRDSSEGRSGRLKGR